jgi:hypothetical protein
MSEHTAGIAKRVAEMDAFEFDNYAAVAADELREHGYAYVDLQPGDATTYKVSIIRPRTHRLINGGVIRYGDPGGEYHIATSFGPLYPWTPTNFNDPGYVQSKWVSSSSPTGEHTAHVLARFLNALSDAMRGDDAKP